MKKSHGLFRRILYDNKILFVASFVLAFIIWLSVTISLSPDATAVIKDVPVTIDLANSVPAQFDLQIFGQSDFTVNVEIHGKRYIVNSSAIGKNSVKVIAQTAYVDSAGKHSLVLKAAKTNENDEFSIVSISENYIECYFDVYKEQEFQLEPRIKLNSSKPYEDGYVQGEAILSADTVLVSGPATEVGSVEHVYAVAQAQNTLSDTTTYNTEIKAVNSSGVELHYLEFDKGNADVTLTLPLYYKTEKPVSVSFKNAPSYFLDNPLSYTVSPSFITAGVTGGNGGVSGKEYAQSLESIEILSIDFSQIKGGSNEFTVKAEDLSGVIALGDVKEWKVTVSAPDIKSRTFDVPPENVTFTNAPENFNKSFTGSLDRITVYAPQDSIASITPDMLHAVIDLKDYDPDAVDALYPVKITVKNSPDSWVYGTVTVPAGEIS